MQPVDPVLLEDFEKKQKQKVDEMLLGFLLLLGHAPKFYTINKTNCLFKNV